MAIYVLLLSKFIMNKQLKLCSGNAVMILAYLLSDTLVLSILLVQIAAQVHSAIQKQLQQSRRVW